MNGRRPTSLAALAALLALGLILAATGCGGGSSSSTVGGGKPPAYAGAVASPPEPAPGLKLRNSLAEPASLGSYKGKAVFITFIYTHCPDTCPLIVSHLKTARAELGPKAKEMQIVAVSTDPKGDTPSTVKAFLHAHGMTGKMQYLIGSRSELEKAWKAWGVIAKPAKANPNLVEHSALIYGIAADGKITTLYPANFKPSQIVHDVPLLEQQ
jgi:protein SCO1/2